jgi:hypothetical protein
VKEHDATTIARFLEEEIICRFGVPKYILIDNGNEWMKEFDALHQDYGIIHQFIAPAWPQYNGMVERLIQIIKHDVIVLSSANIQGCTRRKTCIFD